MRKIVSSSNLNEANNLGSPTTRYESSIATDDILLTLMFGGLGIFFASLLIRPKPQSTEALLFTLAVAIILLFIAAVRVYITYENKLLSWAEIEDVQIRNGYVSFRQQAEWSGWLKVQAAKIPNIAVFLSLIHYIIETKNTSSDTDLGKLQARYHGNQGTNTSILMGGVMCALGVIAVIAAIAEWRQIAAMLVYLVFAGFLFRFGGRTLLQWWQNRGVVVQVYDEGLVRVKGDDKLRVMWDDIRAVWLTGTNHYYVNSAYTGTSFVYTVEVKDNQRFAFGSEILDIVTLGETIQEQVRERLFPRLLAAYEKGETLEFGSLSLNKEGIDHKNKSLSWAEIEGVKVANGYIVFKQQGGWLNWANVSLDQIPNMSTFLTLIDHIVGLKRGI